MIKVKNIEKYGYLTIFLVSLVLLLVTNNFSIVISKTSLLAVFWFGLKISIFPLVFISIQKVIKAKWSNEMENYFQNKNILLPIMIFSGFPVFILGFDLFPWDDIKSQQLVYFQPVLFLGRYTLFGAGMLYFHYVSRKGSLKKNILFLVFLTFFIVLLSIDWIQFYHHNFSSAVFGFSQLAGIFYTGMAFWLLQAIKGQHLNSNTLEPMSRYLLALAFIWLYFYFYQLIILWYSKLDDQNNFYRLFINSENRLPALINVLLSFIIPFLILIKKDFRKNLLVIRIVCFLILTGSMIENVLLFQKEIKGLYYLGFCWIIYIILLYKN